jgi:hypothetical protein
VPARAARNLLAVPSTGSRTGPRIGRSRVTGGRSNGTRPELRCVGRRIVLVRLRSGTTFRRFHSGSAPAGIAGLARPSAWDALTIGPAHLTLGTHVRDSCLLCARASSDEKGGDTNSRPDQRPHLFVLPGEDG